MGAGGMVEYLLSKHEAQSSNSSTADIYKIILPFIGHLLIFLRKIPYI
jgi:hypothetical protein